MVELRGLLQIVIDCYTGGTADICTSGRYTMLMHAARLELLLLQGYVSFCLPEAEIDRRCAWWPEAVAVLAGLASLDLPCRLTVVNGL